MLFSNVKYTDHLHKCYICMLFLHKGSYKIKIQNATVSVKIGNLIEKAKKGATSIHVTHKDVTAHFSALVPHFN